MILVNVTETFIVIHTAVGLLLNVSNMIREKKKRIVFSDIEHVLFTLETRVSAACTVGTAPVY